MEKERIRKRILDKNEKRVKGVETAKALVREIISLHDQGNAAGPAAAQAAEVLRVTQLGFREANRQYAEVCGPFVEVTVGVQSYSVPVGRVRRRSGQAGTSRCSEQSREGEGESGEYRSSCRVRRAF